jgi:hypothetical protein
LTPNDCFFFLKEIEFSILTEGREIHLVPAIELMEIYRHTQVDDPFSPNGIYQALESVKARREVCKSQGNAVFQILRANFENNHATFYIAQMVREYRWLFFYLMK